MTQKQAGSVYQNHVSGFVQGGLRMSEESLSMFLYVSKVVLFLVAFKIFLIFAINNIFYRNTDNKKSIKEDVFITLVSGAILIAILFVVSALE